MVEKKKNRALQRSLVVSVKIRKSSAAALPIQLAFLSPVFCHARHVLGVKKPEARRLRLQDGLLYIVCWVRNEILEFPLSLSATEFRLQ